MADSDEDKFLLLERSARATRGKRMTKLLDDETEEDELFWNQDALKEEENDINYEEEPETEDVFDSDFDEDESEPDDEAENVPEERLPMKKRLIFPGKTLRKQKSKEEDLSKLDKVPKPEEASEKKKSTSESPNVPDDAEAERTVRKSTRTLVIVRQAERDAIHAALQATMKPIKRKKEGEEKRMTQEEMLLEAVQTGIQTLEFSKGATFQSEICTTSISYSQKSLCVVTGLPAKYRDPKTGFPYAAKEAFKVIRECLLKEESDRKEQKKADMGCLLDSISGKGFSSKKKRSRPGTTKLTDWWLGARFRRIPALENLDEDQL